MEEEWREIPGCDGHYEASSLGRIRRARAITGTGHAEAGRIIAQFLSNAGYWRCGLSRDGLQRHRFVHRLVALAFLGPSTKPTVNHLNGVKTDNRPENLEWATRSENYRHALTQFGHQPPRGLDHWNAKKSPDMVREVRRRVGAGESHTSVAQAMGLPRSNVTLIAQRKSWKHIA